ncbi:hypothetical protein EGH82_14290 [Vibrio ponticus]|uniref:Uncharacterized protein n=1 Tax=Vibrio ponticus TaxID=265668 RepID=A0A3N3DXR6_9VIBR|nr:hypothetical protein EGH82_14290 [Vibrio ponticus]
MQLLLHSKTKYKIGFITVTYTGLKTGELAALAVYRTYPIQATQSNLTIKGFLGVSITGNQQPLKLRIGQKRVSVFAKLAIYGIDQVLVTLEGKRQYTTSLFEHVMQQKRKIPSISARA